ncbi:MULTISPECIES: nuclear transport factor 2 family protein [Pedobacter]|uniref:nuclear transport factor 2 family protein n=1 Tax=Pedobacter TaxID=84567 RepID=UPI00210BFE90|nr:MULTISPECIES: nuclear transport factor 2 family protein [unclassified Pedobacter]
MKRRILMYTMMLGIVYTAAVAGPEKPVKNVNESCSTVIEAFVSAYTNGDADLFKRVLHDDAVMSVNRKDQTIKHTRNALISFYKKTGGMKLNCEASHEVISDNGCMMMVRVDFKYPEFVQQNYLTIEKAKSGKWTVTQINRI